MTDIPAHILAQIPLLAAEGHAPGRIAFLLRISKNVVESELKKLGEPAQLTTTTEPPSKNGGERGDAA